MIICKIVHRHAIAGREGGDIGLQITRERDGTMFITLVPEVL